MRFTGSVFTALLLGACASATPPPVGTPCPDLRPQVCTREYNPACAVMADGGRRTYATACTACADADVIGTEPGPCPE